MPNAFGLGLNTFDRIYEDDGAVDDAACTLNLHTKIRMSGGINQIEIPVFPFDGYTSGLNGYAALAFCRKKIGSGTTSID